MAPTGWGSRSRVGLLGRNLHSIPLSDVGIMARLDQGSIPAVFPSRGSFSPGMTKQWAGSQQTWVLAPALPPAQWMTLGKSLSPSLKYGVGVNHPELSETLSLQFRRSECHISHIKMKK